MIEHEFGGDWTEQKLKALGSYLQQYRLIFTQNERAKYFKTIYIDAFAGTGERKVKKVENPTASMFDDDSLDLENYRKGSARIALELDSPFDEYIFVDKNKSHIAQLQETVTKNHQHLLNRCIFHHGDGPSVINQLCNDIDWKHSRAVMFLDPYGMNVEWELLCSIAETRAIDLWLLFPLGTGINRLLTRQELPEESFSAKLTRIFGIDDWKQVFYRKETQANLFSESDGIVKDTNFKEIGEFFISRMEVIFSKVAPKSKALYNSRRNPMYLLCFAAGNSVGAPTAVKIADYLLRN